MSIDPAQRSWASRCRRFRALATVLVGLLSAGCSDEAHPPQQASAAQGAGAASTAAVVTKKVDLTSDANRSTAKQIAESDLEARVKKALLADHLLRDQPIDVSVSGGDVHLWGTVVTTELGKRAVRIVEALPGVKSVQSSLATVSGS